MERRDYFKKQIDQLGRVLGKILADFLALKNTPDVNEAVNSSVESLKTKLDLDPEILAAIPPSEIINKLKEVHDFSNDNLDVLANLFLAVAEVNATDRQWLNLMAHSLAIFQYLETVDSTFSLERRFKIVKIRRYGIDLPSGT